MSVTARARTVSVGRVRFGILAMLAVITMVNYADRATLSIAGPALSRSLHLDAVQMGYVFSAFGWSYVVAQLPGGWLLDRFGSKTVYFGSIVLWSLFTLLQGGVAALGAGAAVVALFALRLLVGLAEAPSFPANGRIVAAWFPAGERGTASAIFNSAQYFATVVFAPLMGWITVGLGWPWVFVVMGGLGIAVALVWTRVMYTPLSHPRLGAAELTYLREGGALVSMDQPDTGRTEWDEGLAARGGVPPAEGSTTAVRPPFRLAHLRELLRSRMMVGIYLGQYCINTLTYFFITWFPVYLVQQRHMSILHAGLVASIPAICGFSGGVLGGIWSDALLRRGWSLAGARKLPLVAGLLLSTVMVACNYVDAQWLVVLFMALSFFGKGIGALGWAVLSDAAPREIAGLSGGLFNMFGNLSSITTPIAIGYIIQGTGSYNGALVFVGANAVVAVLSYLLVVGDIRRLVLKSG